MRRIGWAAAGVLWAVNALNCYKFAMGDVGIPLYLFLLVQFCTSCFVVCYCTGNAFPGIYRKRRDSSD